MRRELSAVSLSEKEPEGARGGVRRGNVNVRPARHCPDSSSSDSISRRSIDSTIHLAMGLLTE